MKKLIMKFLAFSIGPVGAAALSFITIPIITFYISPEDFGIGNMFILYISVILSFSYFGIDQAYTREYHEEKDKENLFKNAMMIPILFSFILLIFLYVFSEKVSYILFSDDSYNEISILFGCCIILMVIERFALLFLRMQEKAIAYSAFNILSKLLILIFTFVCINLLKNNFLIVIYPIIFAQIISTTILCIWIITSFSEKWSFKLDVKLLKRMLTFGFPLVISTSIYTLIISLDRIFLKNWSNFEEIGIYVSALKIASILAVLQVSFSNFWIPTAYRWNMENKNMKYFELVSKIVAFGMSIVFFMILLTKDYIILMLSPEYEDAKYLIVLLCIQPIMYTMSETTVLGIVFSRRSNISIWISLITLAVNLILAFLLIPKFGAVGAAVVTAVSFIVFFIVRTEFSKKYWTGFVTYPQYILAIYMFILALLNVFYNFNLMFQIISFIMLIFLQISVVKEIFILIISKKSRRNWDYNS